MRTLRFIVEELRLKKDPECDFTGLVSGTRGYYKARFAFSREWKGLKKVVIFSTRDDKKFIPIFNDAIEIPKEITDNSTYYVSVYGKSDEYELTTNLVTIFQRKGGVNG